MISWALQAIGALLLVIGIGFFSPAAACIGAGVLFIAAGVALEDRGHHGGPRQDRAQFP